MKKTLTFNDFIDEWNKWEDRKNIFSYQGKIALFDYLREYEEDTGEKIELDIIALCYEYTEYDNLAELQKNYNDIKTIEELQENTQYIPIMNDDGTKSERFIILNY